MSGIRKCSFKIEWLADLNFKDWIEESKKDRGIAFCKVCKKSFDVTNMGVAALRSHMSGAKHKKSFVEMQKVTRPLQDFFIQSAPTPKIAEAGNLAITTTAADKLALSNSAKISCISHNESTMKAEILWTLNMVVKHMSFNSCKDNKKLFATMFPDSAIAKSYSCGADKSSYLLCFGLAPYFKQQLVKSIRSSDFFVACFDESMNKIFQQEQMDIVIRFWDEKSSHVLTRYLGSEYLGHTRAKDLLSALQNGIGELNQMNLLQIGMDGPNVNLKMLEDYMSQRREEHPDYPSLINIGSCSVHTLHRAFQVGALESGWNLAHVLRCAWQVFKDSSARRKDYIDVNDSCVFPLKFCSTRWVEDVAVADRAISIWPQVIKFVNSYKDKPKSVSSAKSFQTLKEVCKDQLLVAKLSFFSYLGKQLEPYLRTYQTDSPMIPFQASDIMQLLYVLMSLFIKKEILDKAKDHVNLLKINVKEEQNLMPFTDIEIGFAARRFLRNSLREKKISERDIFQFRGECCTFFKVLVGKIQERNPLKYPVVRHSRCLDPRSMLTSEADSVKAFSQLLQELQDRKLLGTSKCDTSLAQFKLFITEVRLEAEEFTEFDRATQRLDLFYGKYLLDNKNYIDLWDVVKIILILSHGQASVERGFSVNKEMIVENLKEETLSAMRVVFDEIKNKEITEVTITKELLASAKASRMRYQAYLEDQRKLKFDNENTKKRGLIQKDIEDLKKKKAKLEKAVGAMKKEADEMAEVAEKRQDFILLSKSNAYRRKSLDTVKEIASLDAEIKTLAAKVQKHT